jgi:hypothetical protein
MNYNLNLKPLAKVCLNFDINKKKPINPGLKEYFEQNIVQEMISIIIILK